MKPRYVSLALALGLFVLALWFAFRPAGTRTGPEPPATPSAALSTATSPGAAARPSAGPDRPQTPTTSPPGVASLSSPARLNNPAASPALADALAATATTSDSPPAPRDARIDVDKVRLMMRDYHTLTGENPVGTNAEIMKSIMGGNSKEATLGPPEGITLNGKGELIDQWSTPYFFHQLSKDVMEIRSAGPDKVMWTADDIVTR